MTATGSVAEINARKSNACGKVSGSIDSQKPMIAVDSSSPVQPASGGQKRSDQQSQVVNPEAKTSGGTNTSRISS